MLKQLVGVSSGRLQLKFGTPIDPRTRISGRQKKTSYHVMINGLREVENFIGVKLTLSPVDDCIQTDLHPDRHAKGLSSQFSLKR